MAATGKMAWPPVVGNPGDIHASALNPVGMVAWDDLGRAHVYIGGHASMLEGFWVTYDEAGVVTPLAANAVGPVAVGEATIPSGSYGWAGVFGAFNALLAANCADNAKLNRETTDGYAGDSAVAGDVITGAVSRGATTTAALAVVQLCFPSVNDQSA